MSIFEQAYKELESKSIQEKYAYNLSNIMKSARTELLRRDKNVDEIIKAGFEIMFLNFVIRDNQLFPIQTVPNEKGELCSYPTLNNFEAKTYDYLIEREKVTTSIDLKARYAHILWLSSKKDITYARTAIDQYLKIVKIRVSQDAEFPKEKYGSKIFAELKNAFLLSLTVNYRNDELKNELLELVQSYPLTSSSAGSLKCRLIEFMLEQKSVFKVRDFENIVKVCEELIKDFYAENEHSCINVLELIIRVEKKLRNDTRTYEIRIAQIWEKLSFDREDNTKLVALEFCKRALTIYKKVKSLDKVKDLEDRFNELRKNIRLTEFSKEIDITEDVNSFKVYADKLTECQTESILDVLMNDNSFLPTLTEVSSFSETGSNDLSSVLGNSIMDRNGNIAQHFSEKDELKYRKILINYADSLQFRKLHLISEVIFAGIKKGKLTSITFLTYLKNNSWLGKELTLSLNGQRETPYCWLGLIAPAINDYFINLEYYIHNQISQPNFILCIDSLTVKIEGILRDLCEYNNITTFELRTDKKDRTVSQEKDIHKLLFELEKANLINEDDLLFFKFLLVEKAGFNLRNKVAHSLMTFNEYGMHLMNLLIMAVLKFGKYNFQIREESKIQT